MEAQQLQGACSSMRELGTKPFLNHFFGPTRASDIEITPRSDCKLGTLQIEGEKELTAERERSLQRPTELPLAAGGRWFYIPGANTAAQ